MNLLSCGGCDAAAAKHPRCQKCRHVHMELGVKSVGTCPATTAEKMAFPSTFWFGIRCQNMMARATAEKKDPFQDILAEIL